MFVNENVFLFVDETLTELNKKMNSFEKVSTLSRTKIEERRRFEEEKVRNQVRISALQTDNYK